MSLTQFYLVLCLYDYKGHFKFHTHWIGSFREKVEQIRVDTQTLVHPLLTNQQADMRIISYRRINSERE